MGPGRATGIAAAAALAVGATLWLSRPQRPPAVVTATAGAVVNGSVVDPGTALAIGQTISVTQGGVELTLDTGAVVVVAAPARLTLAERNVITLAAGSMTAHVPPPAVGFRVDAPGLSVVDRGTNFGLRTSVGKAETALDVFDGKVDATALDDHGTPISDPVRVTTGHAVEHDAAAIDPRPEDAAFEPDRFARSVADIRESVPLHGTAADVAMGFADPLWQVISVPGNPAWKPRPAYAVTLFAGVYPPNEPEAKWISTGPDLPQVVAGNYVYRTTVDLTGFDPQSLTIRAQLAADDGIEQVRVNGVNTGIAVAPVNSPTDDMTRTVEFPPVFRTGQNEVEIVVINQYARATRGGKSACALKWKWIASACRPVRR